MSINKVYIYLYLIVTYGVFWFFSKLVDHATKMIAKPRRSQVIFVLPASYTIPLVWKHATIKYNSCFLHVRGSSNHPKLLKHTVDGRNPAPPGMYRTLLIMVDSPYQLVQDFFHQQHLHPPIYTGPRCCMSVVRMIFCTHMHMY